MELTGFIRILRRRWWLAAIPLAFSAVPALVGYFDGPAEIAAGFSAQIRYSAAQKLNLPQRDGDYQDVWLASELTVNALTEWVRSASFREEIIAELAGGETAPGPFGIAADNARSIGVIYLSHAQADALETIAQAAVLILSQRSQAYFPQLGGEAAQVTILEQPFITTAPRPLANRFAPLIQVAVGLFIGLALAFSAEYLDPTIYHQDDIRRLGLPLAGVIPKRKS